VLPLTPTRAATGDSPYSSVSVFAGNPLLISPELLSERGLLPDGLIQTFPVDRAAYSPSADFREDVLGRAARAVKENTGAYQRFREFQKAHASWLDDYCLFETLKKRLGGSWIDWPLHLRDREDLQTVRRELESDLEIAAIVQFLFFDQWGRLRAYCGEKGVLLIGDMPLYVSHDSADVWSHPRLFKLDRTGSPLCVSGVPPDYFSPTGQLWNNPIYDWEAHEEEDFRWWRDRVSHNLELFDRVRIDHFRGLQAFWEVEAGEDTAVSGRWSPAPGEKLLSSLESGLGELPLIAEDLGDITDEVYELRDLFDLPGMRVFQFGFDGEEDSRYHQPHRYPPHCLAYTGTHDNNTLHGWLAEEKAVRRRVLRYVGRRCSSRLHWHIVREIMVSDARWVLFPLQDILGLGGEARMNRPSIAHGNWRWRMSPGAMTPSLANRLDDMTDACDRKPRAAPGTTA
jgi:4-alpha-glucanotransferase